MDRSKLTIDNHVGIADAVALCARARIGVTGIAAQAALAYTHIFLTTPDELRPVPYPHAWTILVYACGETEALRIRSAIQAAHAAADEAEAPNDQWGAA